MVVQKLHICEKVYFDQLFGLQILLLLFLHTLLLCHIFNLWMLDFFNTIKVDGPDLGPNGLQRLLADNKS